MRGSLLMTFDEVVDGRGGTYYDVFVGSERRQRSFTDQNNLYSTFIYTGDVVTISIQNNQTTGETYTVIRRDYTTDDTSGNMGVIDTTLIVFSGGTGATLVFTATTVDNAYNFEYRVQANLGILPNYCRWNENDFIWSNNAIYWGSCSTTPPPTLYSKDGFSGATLNSVCGAGGSGFTVWWTGVPTILVGTVLYVNPNLATPLPTCYFNTNDGNVYVVTNGTVTSITACPTPTPTPTATPTPTPTPTPSIVDEGRYIVAIAGAEILDATYGTLFLSSNSGTTFTTALNNIQISGFTGYTTSADISKSGQYLTATVWWSIGNTNVYRIYRSADFGSTWQNISYPTPAAPTNFMGWYSCSISPSGQYQLLAADGFGINRRLIWYSSDYGQTWAEGNLLTFSRIFRYWSEVSAADSSWCGGLVSGSPFFWTTSRNNINLRVPKYFDNFTSSGVDIPGATYGDPQGFATNFDATIFAYTNKDDSRVYVGTRNPAICNPMGGISWSSTLISGVTLNESRLDMSTSGSTMAFCVRGGGLYRSTNTGATFTRMTNAGTRTWTDIAVSEGGNVMYAVEGVYGVSPGPGNIYRSTNGGITWIGISLPRYWTLIRTNN